ncbi:hypothetical protein CC1G_13905 [Coprinopsis cinerea okayama7|uniref:Replication protein A C-terminal domain-containing protein n=1 Tax=Coprinopsis cinerea (strain Okayama-7 / 130 / ATCC MYA-4618 / FGSC 9003) TaxID=240176 RepID=D6RKX3_COPC7|nr:hypothetical protein CC1G_13905 [Coprinopsis cinerea okayama7\|eukprot:XP_002911865.1 hypothetical protein CC1G_13905 [Coprinopsis cinerea okayama7\
MSQKSESPNISQLTQQFNDLGIQGGLEDNFDEVRPGDPISLLRGIRPVTCAHVSSAQPVTVRSGDKEETAYILGKKPFKHVDIVANIFDVEKASNGQIVYTLSDETGQVKARAWASEYFRYVNPSSHLEYVRVTGELETYNKRNSIRIKQIRVLENPHEVYHHLLSILFYIQGRSLTATHTIPQGQSHTANNRVPKPASAQVPRNERPPPIDNTPEPPSFAVREAEEADHSSDDQFFSDEGEDWASILSSGPVSSGPAQTRGQINHPNSPKHPRQVGGQSVRSPRPEGRHVAPTPPPTMERYNQTRQRHPSHAESPRSSTTRTRPQPLVTSESPSVGATQGRKASGRFKAPRETKMSEMQKSILVHLTCHAGREDGCHVSEIVEDIFKQYQRKGMTVNFKPIFISALDALARDGYIYTTIDDEHYTRNFDTSD